MQVLQAGQHKLIYLELQTEMVASIARQAGFETKAKDTARFIHLDLATPSRQGPLLLFDAADPANLGWVSRCQFYVDGRDGSVMQTPMTLSNLPNRAEQERQPSHHPYPPLYSEGPPRHLPPARQAAPQRAGLLPPLPQLPARAHRDRRRGVRRRHRAAPRRTHRATRDQELTGALR